MSNTIIINGLTYEGGSTIVVKGNGTVTVNGKTLQESPDTKMVMITIQGNVDTLTVKACNRVVVDGNVNNLNVGVGDVKCQSVSGSLQSGTGKVTIEKINNAKFE